MESEIQEAYFRELEERLLQPDVRGSADQISRLLADEFIEFGRSGLVYDKQAVIDALRRERPARRTACDFTVRRLSEDVALVTYHSARRETAEAKETHSLRSSIWKRIDERWQMVFHQGTPAAPGAHAAGPTGSRP